MERAREYNEEIIMCFIDYYKAFDCVDHAPLCTTLQDTGFPGHLIHLLGCFYDRPEASVRTQGKKTNSFQIGKGKARLHVLSPD